MLKRVESNLQSESLSKQHLSSQPQTHVYSFPASPPNTASTCARQKGCKTEKETTACPLSLPTYQIPPLPVFFFPLKSLPKTLRSGLICSLPENPLIFICLWDHRRYPGDIFANTGACVHPRLLPAWNVVSLNCNAPQCKMYLIFLKIQDRRKIILFKKINYMIKWLFRYINYCQN